MTLTTSQVDEKIRSLRSLDAVREFIAALGFAYTDEALATRSIPADITDRLVPKSLRTIGKADKFPVVFVQAAKNGRGDLDRQLIRLERELVPKLPAETQDACILIVASAGFERVHFVNAKRTGKRLMLRRFLTGGEHKTRTAAERLAHLQLTGGERWTEILNKVEEAFDRDQVTDQFYKSYDRVFNTTKKELLKKYKDEHLVHQFLHALLNRLMFVYFVQRKRWECFADGDPEFIKTLWEKYNESKYPKDTFYSNWLSTLFFSAFNNKSGYENKGLPPEIVKYFKLAPYLDGGLFTSHKCDDACFEVTDAMFERIFTELLDAYNFTVMEDTPFDQNIAVDPEMLGIVYESLVNTTELSDEKAEAGIFYTPRIEVDFMCRRALVEHLSKHTSASREDIYRFLFQEEGEQVVPEFLPKVRKEIDDALLEVTVVDPACGSGAFLVGMMQVIVELRRELWKQKGNKPDTFDDFKERKNIIERSLYGVDVKDWAISIAELRLWLTLIEVADEKKLDLSSMKIAGEALLPSLSFKLRMGDSLVQEIAGVTIPIRSAKGKLSPVLQRKVTELRKLKTDFFFNRGSVQEHQIKHKEIALYESILDEKIKDVDKRLDGLRKDNKAAFQQSLAHVLDPSRADADFAKHKVKFAEEREQLIDEAKEEKEHLFSIRAKLSKKEHLFWSIEFAEVFQERGGFDIVIGNPPYVQQESIADPFLLEAGKVPSNSEKSAYKEKLVRMLEDDWGKSVSRLNQRADLYVYFYFRGLALLHVEGTFAFISSNSWLDAIYGAVLQEFLLKRARVLAIYDNEAKRSFKRADVNTIIAVLQPLLLRTKPEGEHVARFTTFKVPFEEAVTSDVLLDTESASERTLIRRKADDDGTPIARVVPLSQAELYRQGLEVGNDEVAAEQKIADDDPFAASYGGNKWGGKYLRAPDIYWTLIDRLSNRGTLLGNLVRGQRYLNTGGADGFFIVTRFERRNGVTRVWNTSTEGRSEGNPSFDIETRFLRPAVKNTNPGSLVIEHEDALVLDVPASQNIEGSKVKSYIKWGEEHSFNSRSVTKSQKPWYKAPRQARESGSILWMRSHAASHKAFYNPKLLIGVRFYRLYPKDRETEKSLVAVLNSTVVALLKEIIGRSALGLGALDTALADLLLMRVPWTADQSDLGKLADAFDALCGRTIGPVWEEAEKPDRRRLDRIVFDILGLTEAEREAVYKAVVGLVTNRLKKARSV